ncbi:MAG: ABC transporter permease [Anaerolineae bacterium]
MVRFIVRRLLLIPLGVAAAVTLAYAYAHIVQWDYASRYPELQRRLTVAGRPHSLLEAYQGYVQGLLRLDLGTLRSGASIADTLFRALGASLGLLCIALLISIPIGLTLGIVGARWTRLRPAGWLTVLSTLGLAMPSFYVGSLLILLSVAYALARKGSGGLPFPLTGFGWDRHLVFPVIALMARPTVQVAQVTATLLTGELQKPYVVAARSLGHPRATVKRHHALRNVLAPVTLTIATSLRTLVADLILVEWLFFWPGLGRFLAAALIPARDTNMASSPYLLEPALVAALLGVVAAIFLITDFIATVLVRVLDPRLRVGVAEELTDV